MTVTLRPRPDQGEHCISTSSTSPTSMDYDVTAAPERQRLSAPPRSFKDPKVRGLPLRRLYAQDDPVYPYLDLEGSVEDGVARFTRVTLAGALRCAKMLTHPMNASRLTRLRLVAKYERARHTGTRRAGTDSAPIADTSKPAPGDPAPLH